MTGKVRKAGKGGLMCRELWRRLTEYSIPRGTRDGQTTKVMLDLYHQKER